MKKKIVWIVVLPVIAVVLALAYWVYASFNGSIIKRISTTAEIKKYIAQKYPGEPYDVEFCCFDFKMMNYYCYVQSRESEDTRFSAWIDKKKPVDDFDLMINGRQTTLMRLQRSIDDYAEKFTEKEYPHKTRLVLCDISEDTAEEDIKSLQLDMPFDVKNFPLKTTLTVWTETSNDKPSWDEAASRLRELEKTVRDEIPSVEYYSLGLQEKYSYQDGETVPQSGDNDIYVYNIPKEVIESDGLEEYLMKIKAEQEAE